VPEQLGALAAAALQVEFELAVAAAAIPMPTAQATVPIPGAATDPMHASPAAVTAPIDAAAAFTQAACGVPPATATWADLSSIFICVFRKFITNRGYANANIFHIMK
jgi:hypothetical protein